MTENYLDSFQQLVDVIHELRVKCPWDREQTKESIRHLSIEEVYELSDAILKNDYPEIKVELGDLLLHIVLYAKMAEEKNAFNLNDVLISIKEKLIRRHPHIYGEVEAKDSNTVIRNWEEIKLNEKKDSKKGVLDGVPNSMPSIVKAFRMQEKASNVGFDWERPEQVWEKVEEEIKELKTELERVEPEKDKIESEFGDLLFALVNYSRFINVNPEDALEKTNRKFKARFEFVESQVQKTGKKMKELNLEELDVFWNLAKAKGL